MLDLGAMEAQIQHALRLRSCCFGPTSPLSMAAPSKDLRASGCAISIRATARSASDRPNRYAVPYSVITQWTSVIEVEANSGLALGGARGEADDGHAAR